MKYQDILSLHCPGRNDFDEDIYLNTKIIEALKYSIVEVTPTEECFIEILDKETNKTSRYQRVKVTTKEPIPFRLEIEVNALNVKERLKNVDMDILFILTKSLHDNDSIAEGYRYNPSKLTKEEFLESVKNYLTYPNFKVELDHVDKPYYCQDSLNIYIPFALDTYEAIEKIRETRV